MGVVVQKYGGSSVADVERLRKVADAVVARHRAGDRLVVVVSAMGRTTDELIAKARAIAYEPPARELDMLVTAGERISMALLSMAIGEAGGHAISFTGSQSGIVTDERHQGARILEVRPHRLQVELEAGRIVIVAGYQGVSRNKEITTLGRGGSDTTAVALAAALGADACEIYSDVDGVYSADPNVCEQARLLPKLSYDAMQAMASSGAKVLNADAVEFAKRAGILIHARKTADTSGRETVVGPHGSEISPLAVVGANKVTWLRGPATDLMACLRACAERGARPMWIAGGDTQEAFVDRTGIPGAEAAVVADLARAAGVDARVVATVAAIGPDVLARAPWLCADAADALADCGASFIGGDGQRLLWSVQVEHGDAAVRRLHARWLGGAPAS